MSGAPAHHLAQINLARMLHPLDHPAMAGFVARLEAVNALADESPGFVWRLQGEGGDATSFRPFGDDMLVNMSVWESVRDLWAYAYESAHAKVLARRKEWFEMPAAAHMALWWVPAGAVPTVAEGKARIEHLRRHGPGPHAFTFKARFPAPEPHAAAAGA